MKTINIREVTGKEKIDVMHSLNTYAFRESPPVGERDTFEAMINARKGSTVFGLFENNNPAASSASTRMTQNVRGKLFGARGIWGVATAPQFRRNGYSRQVLQALLEANHLTGAAFSTLYPFRGSFYERLGYVTFPVPKMAKFKPENLSGLLKKIWRG